MRNKCYLPTVFIRGLVLFFFASLSLAQATCGKMLDPNQEQSLIREIHEKLVSNNVQFDVEKVGRWFRIRKAVVFKIKPDANGSLLNRRAAWLLKTHGASFSIDPFMKTGGQFAIDGKSVRVLSLQAAYGSLFQHEALHAHEKAVSVEGSDSRFSGFLAIPGGRVERLGFEEIFLDGTYNAYFGDDEIYTQLYTLKRNLEGDRLVIESRTLRSMVKLLGYVGERIEAEFANEQAGIKLSQAAHVSSVPLRRGTGFENLSVEVDHAARAVVVTYSPREFTFLREIRLGEDALRNDPTLLEDLYAEVKDLRWYRLGRLRQPTRAAELLSRLRAALQPRLDFWKDPTRVAMITEVALLEGKRELMMNAGWGNFSDADETRLYDLCVRLLKDLKAR